MDVTNAFHVNNYVYYRFCYQNETFRIKKGGTRPLNVANLQLKALEIIIPINIDQVSKSVKQKMI